MMRMKRTAQSPVSERLGPATGIVKQVLPEHSTSCAVLVGADRFTHERLPDLPAVSENLRALRRILMSADSWELPDERCVAVELPGPTGEQPGPHEILRRIEAVAGMVTDTLLVYYAGHGETCNTEDRLYLALPDSDPDIDYSMIQYDNLRGILRRAVHVRRKVLVLDCCYAARAFDGRMGSPSLPQLSGPIDIAGTVMLSAVSETRQAAAPIGGRYTAYTGAFVEVLESGIPGEGEWLTVKTIHERISEILAASGHPAPQISSRNLAQSITLSRNLAYRPLPAPADAQAHGDAMLRFQKLSPEGMVETLVEQLRELRMQAGSPTLRALTRSTGLSQPVITEAFSGTCLPDLTVLNRLVTALDSNADQEAWETWWSASIRHLRRAHARGEWLSLALQPPSRSLAQFTETAGQGSFREGLHRVTVLAREAEREAGQHELPGAAQQALNVLAQRLPRQSRRLSDPSWTAVRDYLMLVVQLFDPDPFPVHRTPAVKDGGVALVETVLPRLADLSAEQVTGVAEWNDLAEEIYRQIFTEREDREAEKDKRIMDSMNGQINLDYRRHLKDYGAYRADAATNALRLARLSAPSLPPNASVPAKPVTIDDFSPLPTTPSFLEGERYRMGELGRFAKPAAALMLVLGSVAALLHFMRQPIAIPLILYIVGVFAILLWNFRGLRERKRAVNEAFENYLRQNRPW